MLEKQDLLSALQEGHEQLLLRKQMRQLPQAAETLAYYARVRKAFERVLGGTKTIANKEQLDDLCAVLSQKLETVEAENVEPHIVERVQRTRLQSKKALMLKAGWRKEDIVEDGEVTETGIKGLNAARKLLGMEKIYQSSAEFLRDHLTEHELQELLCLAHILDPAAVAEILSARFPERFKYARHTIENLREYIGDFDTFSGSPIEYLPVGQLEKFGLDDLRRLLFCRMREQFLPAYQSRGLQGLREEINELLGEDVTSEQKRFAQELIDYYVTVQRTGQHIRKHTPLKKSLAENMSFPGPHQEVAVAEIARWKRFLVADGMGGGKTGSAIAGFEYLRSIEKAHRALIICPSEVVNEWQKRLSDTDAGYFRRGLAPRVEVIRSLDEDRQETWKRAHTADYVVMSITMSRYATGERSHEEFARSIDADYFILDEAHNVKNHRGVDTERMYRISQCPSIQNGYTVLLTGTPLPNTIRDVASQLRLLYASHEEDIKNPLPAKTNFHNLPELSRVVAQQPRMVRNLLLLRMLNRATETCLPVNAKLNIETRESKLSRSERQSYDEVREDPFLTATEKILLLQRICLHPEALEGSVETGESKYDALRKSLDELLEEAENLKNPRSRKVVIATSWLAQGVTRDFADSIDPEESETGEYIAGKLRQEYEQKGVRVFILDAMNNAGKHQMKDGAGGFLYDMDGSVLTETKSHIAEFREHQGPAVLFTSMRVIGEGLDFSFAPYGILLSPPATESSREQFVRRLYRRGQRNDVHLHVLQTQGTIEEGIARYAARKQRIANDLLNGRPLSKWEQQMLDEDVESVEEGGFLEYETRSPRQKLMWIFEKIFASGKESVRELFSMDEGYWGKELAQLYHQDWETSYQGNNARFIANTLLKPYLRGKGRIQVADIACGGLNMARLLQEQKNIDAFSSDINPAQLEAGRSLMGRRASKANQITECAMDELPYAKESMDIAVLSLALHYTKHSPNEGNAGMERVQALAKLNYVLKQGGHAVITLPIYVMREPLKFEKVCATLEKYFGFRILSEQSGLAHSTDQQDEGIFEVYAFTMEKVAPANVKKLTAEGWKALRFSKRKPARPPKPDEAENPYKKRRKVSIPKTTNPGTYHENFAFMSQRQQP